MCARGVTDEEVENHTAFVTTLKIGELFTEQIPQLISNTVSLMLRCGGYSFYKEYTYSSLGVTKAISMVTSIIGITVSICNWVQ